MAKPSEVLDSLWEFWTICKKRPRTTLGISIPTLLGTGSPVLNVFEGLEVPIGVAALIFVVGALGLFVMGFHEVRGERDQARQALTEAKPCPKPELHQPAVELTPGQEALIPARKEIERLGKLCPTESMQSATPEYQQQFAEWLGATDEVLARYPAAQKHFRSAQPPASMMTLATPAYRAWKWRHDRFNEAWEMVGEADTNN